MGHLEDNFTPVPYIGRKVHKVKKIALVANGVIRPFHFQIQYDMPPHGSSENGLNWEDALIPYHQLQTTVT